MASLAAVSRLDQLVITKTAAKLGLCQDIVLVVGCGDREHALAVALAKSPLKSSPTPCQGAGTSASISSTADVAAVAACAMSALTATETGGLPTAAAADDTSAAATSTASA
jgi:hypothetical protein